MVYEVPHFINGQRVSHGERRLAIMNPGLGEQIGFVNVAAESVVDRAVKAASVAQEAWAETTLAQRTKLMFRYRELVEANSEELIHLITQEHGKTLKEARGSLSRGLEVVDFACGIAKHLQGTYSAQVASGVNCYSLHQPVGVCAGITPFNFPAMIPLWMFPMAIACGNSFILKPSEKDPSCGLRLVELAHEAGVPAGVVNVVQGDKETVDAILHHPAIQAVSFVGSTPVAEYVYHTASQKNKRVQAFGGAKNHAIVLPDADLAQTAAQLCEAAYGSAGERCMAISAAVVVGDETADRLIKALLPLVQQIKIGVGTHDVDMGPLITEQHLQRVTALVAEGEQAGAKLLLDGRQIPLPKQGYFLGGCLFDQVTPGMRIYQEEIFGPVLCIVRVATFDEALKLINDNAYGNGTAIFTKDGAYARAFAQKVKVGMVGINVQVPVPVGYHSFGGWKRSIFADVGMYGSESVRFYTKLKTVTERW